MPAGGFSLFHIIDKRKPEDTELWIRAASGAGLAVTTDGPALPCLRVFV